MRPRQRPWKWLLLGLIVVAVAGLLLLPRQIGTSSELRDRVAAALSDWTGATVTLTEPLEIRYFPPLSLRGGLVISNATKLPSVRAIAAPDVTIYLDFADLLLGRLQIDAVLLGKPTITLKEPDDLEQTRESLAASVLRAPAADVIRIRDGAIKAASGKRVIKAINVRMESDGSNGAFEALGSFVYRGEAVSFSLESGAISDAESGKQAPVSLKVTADPVTARFSGTARFAGGLEADGTLDAEIGDGRRFLTWVGLPLPEGDSLKDLSVSGTVHWANATLTVDDGTFSLDGNEAVGLVAISADERVRVEGTLAFERLVLDPYIGKETDAAPGADGALLDWALLKYIDADLRISAADVVLPPLDLGRGGFTITAKGGAISSEIGELQLCNGQAEGRVGLDLSRPRTEASFIGNVSGVAIDACLKPFGFGVPASGIGALKIDVSSGGTKWEELIRSLAGELKASAQNGTVPIDFAAVSAGKASKGEGWSRDAVTAFDTLDADCRLSAGHIWCQSFRMQTPQGTVTGSGDVDMGKQTLDWNFLIANPVAPLDAAQLVMEPPPRVTVRGSLTEPVLQGPTAPTLGDGSSQTSPESSSALPR